MAKLIKSVLSVFFAAVFLLTAAGSLSSCSYNDFVNLFIAGIPVGVGLAADVPEPEIKHAEFPFTLTYEVDGEIKTIQDSIVCEFSGFSVYGMTETRRKWKIYLKSKPDEVDKGSSGIQITLLDLRDSGAQDHRGEQMVELYFYGGNAEYYMGDDLLGIAREAQKFDNVRYISVFDLGEFNSLSHGSLTAEEAMEKYKIRLLSWKVAEPIVNSFS